ncbi:MAG: MFS transporter [Thiothrix sp.]|nr:MAG: MFS transporter [Thiothrix sp.]
MSTIVAVKKNQKACIAADSLTTFGDTRQSAALDASHEKILKQGDSYVGLVGSAAHQLVIGSAFASMEAPDLHGREAIFESFRKLHPVLKDSYFLNPKDEEGDAYESSHIDALVINPAGVFGVYALREVFEYTRYWAVGSGAEYALGAMHALYDQLDDPEMIARAAIEAGAEFDISSALPMTLYQVDMEVKAPETMIV